MSKNSKMITALFQPSGKKTYPGKPVFWAMCFLFAIAWCWFCITAKEKTDWWIENILVILFFVVLLVYRKRIVLSYTGFTFIFLFLLLHIYGARMAYTENELGEYLQNTFHLQRNPYDRIVHFSFGFLLLYPFTEILSGYFPQKKNFVLLFANMFIFCLAAAFELIEWGVASVTDKVTGETYVATQGDPWDAQKDIVLAVAGALLFTGMMKIARRKKV